MDHAASKVAEAGHSGLIFIYGPNAKPEADMSALVEEYEGKGFNLTFVSAKAFAEGVISLAPSVTPAVVVELLNKHLALTRAKEVTIHHCKEVIDKM